MNYRGKRQNDCGSIYSVFFLSLAPMTAKDFMQVLNQIQYCGSPASYGQNRELYKVSVKCKAKSFLQTEGENLRQ